jgi:hypothetical protein
MADYRDVMGADSDADSAQASLQTYGGQIEDGKRENLALAVCLAADAVCARLHALTIRLDYLSHDRS